MDTCAIYCRISSDPTGRAAGVTRQQTECRELAEHLGWEVAAVYIENDTSAYSGKRPEFQRLLTDLRVGRVGAVVCWHPDRLYRRLADLAELTAALGDKPVRTVCAGDLDLSTASGRMQAQILGAVAEHEVAHAVERMTAAHKSAATQGVWRSRRRPFGYTRHGEIVPGEAELIRQAAADVLSGNRNATRVCEQWNEAGVPTTQDGARWTATTLLHVLESPTTAGLSVYRREVVGVGQWEPILTPATREALLALRPRRAQQPKRRRWQGSGVYVCGRCGSVLRAYVNPAGGVETYVCRARSCVSRKVVDLDGYVDRLVRERLSTMPTVTEDAPAVDTSGEKVALQTRLDDLAGAYADGSVTLAQLTTATRTIRARLDELEQATVPARTVDVAELGRRYDALPATDKARVIRTLMVVTVDSAGRGARSFDPSRVHIAWR